MENFYNPSDLENRIGYNVKNKIQSASLCVPMPDQEKWIDFISDLIYCHLIEYHNNVLANAITNTSLSGNWEFRQVKDRAEAAERKVEALSNTVLELQGQIERLLSQAHGPDYGQRGRIQDVALNAIRTGE